ncbi:hypothetical protein [Phaffia rhodozyma]|uniref:Uncharacterized protein n=1 Tax=Phaffia rhodozyma TaxID=264483 RepID=A0A0F7SG61_PHARH|nr:hypothetical protein [Phaffia rhodozyma]
MPLFLVFCLFLLSSCLNLYSDIFVSVHLDLLTLFGFCLTTLYLLVLSHLVPHFLDCPLPFRKSLTFFISLLLPCRSSSPVIEVALELHSSSFLFRSHIFSLRSSQKSSWSTSRGRLIFPFIYEWTSFCSCFHT